VGYKGAIQAKMQFVRLSSCYINIGCFIRFGGLTAMNILNNHIAVRLLIYPGGFLRIIASTLKRQAASLSETLIFTYNITKCRNLDNHIQIVL
jgi:hypothetical protein